MGPICTVAVVRLRVRLAELGAAAPASVSWSGSGTLRPAPTSIASGAAAGTGCVTQPSALILAFGELTELDLIALGPP